MMTPEQFISNLTTSYRLAYIAIAMAILVELICYRRVRRFNAWLSLLAGAAVCLQTVVMVIMLTLKWDDVSTIEALLKVNMLGYSGVALVGMWLGARRVWLERSLSRAPMAWIRASALALLTFCFCYQVAWGQWMLELLATARRG